MTWFQYITTVAYQLLFWCAWSKRFFAKHVFPLRPTGGRHRHNPL